MSQLTGKTLGEYQLTELISQSGNTILFKAFQPSKNRYLAVKVLTPDLSPSSSDTQRFLQQAQLASQMSHPNLLPVYDSGQAEGVAYLSSAFSDRGNLDNNLSHFYNPLEAQALINRIVDALDYIHGQGYVHGNLKPANVFLDAGNSPLLADFGLAQPLSASASPYLSPEQREGGIVDKRADIYALGVLLFEVLTGAPPPVGTVVSLHSKRPDLPVAVEKVIFKAMAQNPDARFQSAREFRSAFASSLQAPLPPPQPVYAPPPQSYAPPPPPPARKSTNWSSIILTLLIIIMLCVAGWFLIDTIKNEDGTPTDVPGESTEPAPGPTDAPLLPTDSPAPTSPPEIEPTSPPETEPTKEGEVSIDPVNPASSSPPICGSIGVTGGAIVLGGATQWNRRRKKKTEIDNR